MLFLASKPYHAFTRRQISDAVTCESHPVSEDSVDRHIASLIDQLGVLHDFVQSVPYVGTASSPSQVPALAIWSDGGVGQRPREEKPARLTISCARVRRENTSGICSSEQRCDKSQPSRKQLLLLDR